jgi:hypothetical protein
VSFEWPMIRRQNFQEHWKVCHYSDWRLEHTTGQDITFTLPNKERSSGCSERQNLRKIAGFALLRKVMINIGYNWQKLRFSNRGPSEKREVLKIFGRRWRPYKVWQKFPSIGRLCSFSMPFPPRRTSPYGRYQHPRE